MPPPGREDSPQVPKDLASSLVRPPTGPADPEVGYVRDSNEGISDEKELASGPIDPGPSLEEQEIGRPS
eukprot:11462150-Alexandrium_andersonii.AAC.1